MTGTIIDDFKYKPSRTRFPKDIDEDIVFKAWCSISKHPQELENGELFETNRDLRDGLGKSFRTADTPHTFYFSSITSVELKKPIFPTQNAPATSTRRRAQAYKTFL